MHGDDVLLLFNIPLLLRTTTYHHPTLLLLLPMVCGWWWWWWIMPWYMRGLVVWCISALLCCGAFCCCCSTWCCELYLLPSAYCCLHRVPTCLPAISVTTSTVRCLFLRIPWLFVGVAAALQHATTTPPRCYRLPRLIPVLLPVHTSLPYILVVAIRRLLPACGICRLPPAFSLFTDFAAVP